MINKIIAVLFVHWIADFILQTRKMGTLKSTSLQWLTIHITVYTIPLFLFGWKFALVNGVAHFIVDFFSSRASSYFYKKENMHAFWMTIGFDQFLHVAILIKSLEYFA